MWSPTGRHTKEANSKSILENHMYPPSVIPQLQRKHLERKKADKEVQMLCWISIFFFIFSMLWRTSEINSITNCVRPCACTRTPAAAECELDGPTTARCINYLFRFLRLRSPSRTSYTLDWLNTFCLFIHSVAISRFHSFVDVRFYFSSIPFFILLGSSNSQLNSFRLSSPSSTTSYYDWRYTICQRLGVAYISFVKRLTEQCRCQEPAASRNMLFKSCVCLQRTLGRSISEFLIFCTV